MVLHNNLASEIVQCSARACVKRMLATIEIRDILRSVKSMIGSD